MEACDFWNLAGAIPTGTASDWHGWKLLRTGVLCVRCVIPLESRVREIRTLGSEGRGWKRIHGSRTECRRES